MRCHVKDEDFVQVGARDGNFPLNFLSRETGIPGKLDFFPGKSREIENYYTNA